MSILGPLMPVFWASDGVFSGFQSQSGQSYLYFSGRIRNMVFDKLKRIPVTKKFRKII